MQRKSFMPEGKPGEELCVRDGSGGNTSNSAPHPQVPDHELLQIIGRGAYGEVWLARNALGTLRAVKVVYRRGFEDAECFEREFTGLQKFEPISRLNESLIQVLQIGRREQEGWFFYVMELADHASRESGAAISESELISAGGSESDSALGALPSYVPRTLSSDLHARGALPLADCLAIGIRLASALAFLHERGLVHRDIKPSNIIFVRGQAKLADIGLVTGIDEAHSLVGTAGYIPPEGPGSAQADIYSLGKVLYEVAFGKKRQEFPQLPADLQNRADHEGLLELNEVILKSCDSNPQSRYATAQQLRGDLELLTTGGSVKGRRTAHQLWAVAKGIAAAALVVGGLSAGASLLWHQTHSLRPLSRNAKALEYYDLACYQVKNRALDTLLPAYTNLTQAVKLDPGFVEAYFKMFELYFGPLGNRLPPHFDQLKNFRAVATKLHEVSPDSVEYHTANSLVEFLDWKFDQAIAEVRLAIKEDPHFLRAQAFYGYYVMFVRGDADTALRQYLVALDLDPERNDTTLIGVLPGPYLFKRDYDGALQRGLKAVELEPRNHFAHLGLADAYLGKGQYTNWLEELKQSELACSQKPEAVEARYQRLQEALARGPHELWRAMIKEVEADPKADPYDRAVLYARLGERGTAITLLKEAFDKRTQACSSLAVFSSSPARCPEPPADQKKVAFGASVTIRHQDGEEDEYMIVGVDEADPASGRISWMSPLARVLLSRSPGDLVRFQSPAGVEELTILKVHYQGN